MILPCEEIIQEQRLRVADVRVLLRAGWERCDHALLAAEEGEDVALFLLLLFQKPWHDFLKLGELLLDGHLVDLLENCLDALGNLLCLILRFGMLREHFSEHSAGIRLSRELHGILQGIFADCGVEVHGRRKGRVF